MTKLIILSLIIAVGILYIASPKINLRPFSVTFTNGWFALGFTLILIGICLIRYQGYVEGARKGIDTAFKVINGLIKKEKI